ncbi:hypothetical protein GCM10010236_48060 [Streptomyces eurythermus]|nr:hypothetical protein GCM10010236_48060 [Streptomyces eurythermus]
MIRSPSNRACPPVPGAFVSPAGRAAAAGAIVVTIMSATTHARRIKEVRMGSILDRRTPRRSYPFV